MLVAPAKTKLLQHFPTMQLYKYQEQSQLLDALLEGIVVPLSTLLRQHATNGQEVTSQSLAQCMGICRLLNVLVAVRGYKTVVKFFPHEAQDLERVLSVLVSIKAMSKTVKTAEQGITLWESQSILLLWLSMLILVPFDLSTIDSTAVNAADIKAQRYTQIVSNLLALCQEYLYQPGKDMIEIFWERGQLSIKDWGGVSDPATLLHVQCPTR